MKTKHGKKIKIVLILLSVVSIVVSLNKFICLPWETKITASNPIAVVSNDYNTVIMDSSTRGLSVLNKDNQIENQVKLDITYPNYYFWPAVILNNDYFYYVLDEYYNNSVFLKSEEIVRTEGNDYETVLNFHYDLDKQKIAQPKILNTFDRNKESYAAVVNSKTNAFAIINISDSSSKELKYKDIRFDKKISSNKSISLIWYDNATDKVYAMDQFGQAYSWDFNASGAGASTDKFESDTYYRTLYALSPTISTSENAATAKDPEFSDDRYNYIKHKPAEVKAVEGKSFYINTLDQIRIWMFWLGILILAFLIILLLARTIHRLRIRGEFAILRRVATFVAIGLVCLIIVVFYSYQVISTSYEASSSLQKVFAQLTQRETADLVVQAKSEFDANGQISPDTYNNLAAILEDSSFVSAKEGHVNGFSIALFKDDRVYPIVNTTQVILSASINKGISELAEPKAGEIYSANSVSVFGSYGLSRVVYTDSSDKPIGLLYATNSNTVISANFLKTCADMFLKLFVAALVIVYAVMEIMAWFAGAKKRRVLLNEGIDFQGIALARPLAFLSLAIGAVDSTLIVLIIKDMLVGTAYENNLLICSLPITIIALGFLFGDIIAYKLLSRFNAKSVLLASTIVMTVSLIAESATVYMNNIPLLFIAMIIMAASNEIILDYAYEYASFAPNDDLRRECNAGLTASKISAYALITIFAGYASTLFGNFAIYLVALLPTAILLAIILLNQFDNRNNSASISGNENAGFKEKMRFLLKPEMLVVVFCGIIASEILVGYNSYVFPLFADQGGLTKSTISNIQVFAKATVFFLIPLLNRYQKRVGEKNLIIINNIILAGIFFMFIINQSVIWAVVALIATYISCRGIESSINFIWQKFVADKKYDPHMAQSAIREITEFIELSKSPILAWLMGFGQLISCVIIGSYLGISALVFKLSEGFAKKKI